MSGLSEDESSDSSREFLVDPDKINLNSSFFNDRKSSRTNSVAPKAETDDESTDDDDFRDVSHDSNVEIFSQVLKNLESSQKLNTSDDNIKKEEPSVDSTLIKKKAKEKQNARHVTSSNEINELLLQGETGGSSTYRDIEEVVEKNEEDAIATSDYTIPKDGVNVILPGTSLMLNRKKKKGGPDLKAILRRRLKANQILIEKVGLLCWLAYGFHLNRQSNQPEVMATALSMVSTSNYPKNRIDLVYLEKFTKWYKNLFTFETKEHNSTINKESLLKALKEKKIFDYKELVLLYIATLRALGLNCRLVISLCPPHRILDDSPLLQPDSKKQKNKSKEKSDDNKEKAASKLSVPENSSQARKDANSEAKKRAADILRTRSQNKGSNKSKLAADKDTKSKRNASIASESTSNKTNNVKKEAEDAKEVKNVSNLRQLRSRKVANTNSEDNKAKDNRNLASKSDCTISKYYKEEDTDSESEFQPKPNRPVKRKINDTQKADTKSKKKNKKQVSSDSEGEELDKIGKAQDVWAEVYLDSEESWICVSVMDEKVHCVTEVYKKAKKPVLYVIAWNTESLIKDVTRRYCPRWLTVTRKQRIDEKWWSETVSHWKEKNTAISREEDEMLLQKELEQPLPKTVGECKGHPLYALSRHLLKYEALYPPDCVPLGHTSTGEAIYSRHCVHVLCSRETWLKKARVVKPSQEPYKIVKALPKYDKLSGTKIKDMPLELFGEWQTMDYEPPEAKNGIVPRNDYGNVDLFKACMLPKGTVHINLPALNRVARKLNIDCAPAVVGFNFGCMGAVPAFEGFVVCSEYEDTLREAWETEQVEAAKRAREKQEKRVYGNWKRLIQGLVIRERLAAKYEFSEAGKSTLSSKRTKQKKTDAKKTKVS